MSTLLDKYLEETSGGSLSATELDQQLQAAQPPSRPAPNNPSPAAGREGQDPMKRFADAFDTIVETEEKASQIDVAVKAASHGIRVLGPLMTAVSRWVDPSEPEKIEETMAAVLQRLQVDTSRVLNAYGLTPQDAPSWLTSQISGQLMDVLVEALDRNNGKVLEANDYRYLAPMLNLAEQAKSIGENPLRYPEDPKWSLTNALTLATSEVMTEYQHFTYFHEDASAIAQEVTNYLADRVIHGTLQDLTERWALSDTERGYLGTSLIKQAGHLMAAAWADNQASTIKNLQELPVESRREALANGYPLDTVYAAFESSYQGLEISTVGALRAMSPMREKAPATTNRSAPAYG